MPRGWRQHDAFWRRMLMGPRPPSVQWPPAKKGNGKGKGQSADVRRIVLFLRAVVDGVVTPRPQNKIASTRKSEGTPTMSRQIVQNKFGSWNKPSRFWAETVHNQQVDFSFEEVASCVHITNRRTIGCMSEITSPKTTCSGRGSSEESCRDSVQVRGGTSRRARQIEAVAEELLATIHASTAAEINQLRVTVQDLQRERDFLRSEMAKNRVEGDQSLLMSTLIDQGDSLRRGVGSNRYNPLS